MMRARVLVTLPALALVTFTLTACTTWRKKDSSVESLLARKPRVHLRVTVEGNDVPIELSSARIVADTLHGWGHYVRDPKLPPPSPSDWDWRNPPVPKADSVAIPLALIRSVEAREFSSGKTVLLVLGIGATVAVVVAAIVAVSDLGDFGFGGGGGSTDGESCPLIYSWDGAGWRLDSGTYAGAIMPALARTDVDVLEHAVALHGEIQLRLTGLSGETEHVDALRIQAVDHPVGTFVAPDDKGALHVLTGVVQPLSARDFRGRDALRRIAEWDGWGWESSPSGRNPDQKADVRDGIEVEFDRPASAGRAYLIVDGSNTPWAAHLMRRFVGLQGDGAWRWYGAVAADPAERAALVAGFARETFLRVSLWDGARWVNQGSIPQAGPEVAKRQALAIDLGSVPGPRVRVRLESATMLWNIDRLRLAVDTGREPVIHDAPLQSAKDQTGRPVESLVRTAADGEEYVIEPGESAELRFRAPAEAPEGLTRTFVARTTGWYEIHPGGARAADPVLAARLVHEPLAASRFSVEELNAALAALDRLAGSR